MGGVNSTEILQQKTTENISDVVNNVLNQTSVSHKVDSNSLQNAYLKFSEGIDNCNIKLTENLISKIDLRTITKKAATNDINDKFINEIKDKFKKSVEQTNKEFNLGQFNKEKTDQIINNLNNFNLKNDIKNLFEQKIEASNKLIQNGGIDARYCKGSYIDVDLSATNNIVSQLTGDDITKNTVIADAINKISADIDSQTKQTNVGTNLTLVLIAMVVAALIYFMAESGTLGQLFGGGGKKSSGGSSGALKKVSSKIGKGKDIERVIASAFGATGKQKAWWVGL